jgi:WD40 repeat protein
MTGAQIDMLTGFERHGSLLVRGGPRPAFLSADKIFLSNTYNFNLELWELSTGRLINTLKEHTSEVTDVVISADGSTLASAEVWDYSVRIWDTETGRNVNTIEAYIDVGYGKSLGISSDGSQIAVGDSRGGGRVYNAETGEQLYAVHSGQRGISNLTFSPDGSRLAVLSGGFSLTLWDAKTGDKIRTIETGPQGGGIAFSPDGEILAVGTRERAIQLWDVATGELTDTLPGDTLAGDGGQIQSLAFSPDGRLLAAGIRDVRMPIESMSPAIWLWDMETKSLVSSKIGYTSNVRYVIFSPDGKFLASSSLDGTLRLWALYPGR